MKKQPSAETMLVPEVPFEDRWSAAQTRYKGTIRTFARNCVAQLPGYSIEDIEQELLVILWKCVLNYDPDKGASFNTLFQGSARRRVISLIRTASTLSRTGVNVSLDIEAVAAAVDDHLSTCSAEDRLLTRLDLQSYISEHGAETLNMERPPRPRAAEVA